MDRTRRHAPARHAERVVLDQIRTRDVAQPGFVPGDAVQLAGRRPAWEPVAFHGDAVILGREVWTARALV